MTSAILNSAVLNSRTTKAVLLATALALGATSAFAQGYPSPQGPSGGPIYAVPYGGATGYDFDGEVRDTAFGAGGTAGTHPTGANVGPGRAQMIHTTGN
jgi:hypothetical protein